MQWTVMYRKEMLEMWRSFKWMWQPLVFILLGAMQPLSTYYMPQILEMAGGLPEGAVIEIPTPTSGQMMAEMLAQFGTIGILVLVLGGMGVVASEKQTRTASLIMVRPVSHASFITAKWASMITLGTVSLLVGSLAGWYYTELLFGHVEFGDMILGVVVYALWLIFIMTLTVWMSTILKGNGAIAFMAILATIAISAATGWLGKWMAWSPSRLSDHAAQLLMDGRVGDRFAASMIGTVIGIGLILIAAIFVFKRQELAD